MSRARAFCHRKLCGKSGEAGSAMVVLLVLSAFGCSHHAKVVRGSEAPGVDQAAFSTGLDRKDLQQLLNENMVAFQASPLPSRWAQEGKPVVSVMPIQNETSEHLAGPLRALLTDIETAFVNSGSVRVVSVETRPQLLEEMERQHNSGGAFDQSQITNWGRQLGARYFVTGKVYSVDERAAESRRVQYFLFLQVMDIETGEILFQNKSAITKALVTD